MKPTAVIVAGGAGSRMGAEVPKQFLTLNDRPLLVHTIEAFAHAFDDMDIIVVLPAAFIEHGSDLIAQFLPGVQVFFTEGGETRFHSVKKGLSFVREPSVVFVHDAVRCLVSVALIRRCYDQALLKGSAIPAVAVRDSMRMLEDDGHGVVDRDRLRAIQTPQTFLSEWIQPAFLQPFEPAFTDEATVVERYGKQVALIDGEETNIKVTFPVDLIIAAEILRARTT